MKWSDVCAVHPTQWLVIEALEAHSENQRRILDRMAVIEVCPDGSIALQSYRRLHQQYPLREFYFVHTGRAELEIGERHWAGVRLKSKLAGWTMGLASMVFLAWIS